VEVVAVTREDRRRLLGVEQEFNMDAEQKRGFRDYLHECKESGDYGTANSKGDYTVEELRQKAQEFLDSQEGEK